MTVNRDAKICAVWVSGLFCFFLKSDIPLNSGINLIVLHNLPPVHGTTSHDGNIIDITIIQENFLSFTAPHWTNGHFFWQTVHMLTFVYPSLQPPTFFFPQGGRVWRS